jgi:RNA polymerase sigma factor (sigma-70 family)
MKWLSKVAEHHEDYLRMVRALGEDFLAEDIVQEMYIKLIKYCTPKKILRQDGQVNKSYVYFVLRNLFLDYQKEKNKHRKVNIDKIKPIGVEYEYIEETEAFTSVIEKIDSEVETWHWYDQMLFELYRESGKSIRKLSKETRISTSSIFQTLKYCKNEIKINVGEDYEDFINEDYELL